VAVWPAGHFARPYPFLTLCKRSGLSRDCEDTHEPFPERDEMDDEVLILFFSLIIPGDYEQNGIGRNLEFINIDDSVIVNIDLARRPGLLFELEGKPSHGENKESFF